MWPLELHCIVPWIREQMIWALVPSLLFTCCTVVWMVVHISFFLEKTKTSFLHIKLPFSRLLRSHSSGMNLSKVTKITLSLFLIVLFSSQDWSNGECCAAARWNAVWQTSAMDVLCDMGAMWWPRDIWELDCLRWSTPSRVWAVSRLLE